MIKGIATVAVVVSNPKKAAKWYRDKLGFEVGGKPDSDSAIVYPRGQDTGTYLQLIAAEGGLRPGGSYVGFATRDFQRTCEELRSKGVEVTEEPTKEAGGFSFALFMDPDGNEFSLIEQAEW